MWTTNVFVVFEGTMMRQVFQHQAHLMRARTFIRLDTQECGAGVTSERSMLTLQRSCDVPRTCHPPRSLRFEHCMHWLIKPLLTPATSACSALLVTVHQSAYNLRWATLPLLQMVKLSIQRPGLTDPTDWVNLLVLMLPL